MSEVKRVTVSQAWHVWPDGMEVTMASDYDRLEAENKALKADRYKDAALIHDLRTELSALRTKMVVVPDEYSEFERLFSIYKLKRHNHGAGGYTDFMTHCVFEAFQAGIRLNGKTVSEGLLREAIQLLDFNSDYSGYAAAHVAKELRALLDKE